MHLPNTKAVIKALDNLSDAQKAAHSARFFKTGKGEYGEGDQFIGVRVPEQRMVAKAFYKVITLDELQELLQSPIHEHRLTALIILVMQYEKTKTVQLKKDIISFYLWNANYINNWDLVDTSCYKILGHYCYHKKDSYILDGLIESEDMWMRRIAIVATLYYIKKGQFDKTFEYISILNDDTNDLIHKAIGWMLRELGKVDEATLINYLESNALSLPRTSLRCAIEKMSPEKRQYFLCKK